ncbi:hypothetical protein FZZ91_01310 [Synechococcus sp. HB1133]|uniref:thiamine pyrophosphate-dependent enzyme n=1 Tax=unclassified Synechococcus TaxID=2626047 RepID=UPI00140D46A6|nr:MULTISPECIES: thiamine pyrophosphate-dependent enzyme [unclassified Synechococcus]MCB4421475.1 hypothetical protein [Synechococcus sp. HB1133]MCB4431174.1 hypothetical protein [Synechococcus sp. HBA1120]NHI80417.1 hypothetical protein [Synechococcus sp. HB1133]
MNNYLPSAFSEFHKIAKIRYWQLVLNEMLLDRKFKIPIHLAFGHESLSVALFSSLHINDKVCLTHRNASYNLCYCNELQDILESYYLSSSENEEQQMGSMNLALKYSPYIYSSSILGNNLSVAAGIAMNRQISKSDGVIFVLTGDGAIEEGSFWETLLFARSHNLKLVIMIENNDYSLGSTIDQRRSRIDLKSICSGLDVKYLSTDGANFSASKDTLDMARHFAEDQHPVCIEFSVSTLCRHAGPTPGWDTDTMKISISDGLIIENTNRDPLFQIKELIGKEDFISLQEFFLK